MAAAPADAPPGPAGTAPRFRAVELFPPVDLSLTAQADGSVVLQTRVPPVAVAPTLAGVLAERAAAHGERSFAAQRDSGGRWQHVSYAEMLDRGARVAGWLAARAARGPERILVVTGNSLAHLTLAMGAAVAGVPVCPVSAQYALTRDGTFGRLRHVVEVLHPSIVFAETVGPVAAALRAVLPAGVTVICTDPQNWAGSVAWTDVVEHRPLPDLAGHVARLDPDLPVRFMLTSGSTGLPKIVVQTNRMWCSLFAGASAVLAEASGWGVRTLDWMPWSHVAGVSVLTGTLVNGGTYYLDDGRPTADSFGATLANLAEVQPLFFANVPYAFGRLCDALEADAELRSRFFEHLQLCLYGGAGLTQPVYDRFQAMAEQTIGERVMFTTGYGCTEATAGVMSISWPTTQVGVGLPLPGVQVKLVPLSDGRYEARFRGACVMPGYLGDPQATAAAFDDEGFYRTGDALRFLDPDRPDAGLVFAGRLAEEFKLATGTFVATGQVRAELLSRTDPVVLDAVICGEGRAELGALLWINPAGCAATLGITASAADLAGDDRVLDWLAERIGGSARRCSGSAARIARFAVLAEPPSVDAGELSDKGSVNQVIARARRGADLERLYATGPGVRVLPAKEE